jgi:hypothetical protein
MPKSLRNRNSRKSRKSKKSKRSRRGGAPAPTHEAILFTVSDMPPGTVRQFRPDYAFRMMNSLKELFIQSVNDYKEEEPEDDTVLEEDIRIHLIRGAEDTVLFEGKIANWTDIQMQTFLSGLQVGDRVHIELIQS